MSCTAKAGRVRLPVVPFPLALSVSITTVLVAGAQALDPWPVLERASETYQTVRTLSAEFVQIVTNPMLGEPDTTRGHLYQLRPSRFAMRFTAPEGDRIVADGRFLWLYTPSTTPGQVLRSRIPEYGSTGPNLIGQFVEHPRERYSAQHLRVETLASGVAPGRDSGPDTVDVVALVPKHADQPYSRAVIWVSRVDGLVHRLDISEASGQERTVILTRLRVNTGVPGRELTFSPPAGVRVVDQ